MQVRCNLMKRLLFILTILFLANYSSAQDSLALKQQYCFHYLQDSTLNRIDYGCGWAGLTSTNLYYFRYLISGNRFDLISKLLDSETASTRYLAAASIIRADKKSHFKPDSLTVLKIKVVTQDKETIPFCSGCTGHWNYSIKRLLDKKEKTPMAKWTNDWIDDSFK